MQYHEWVVFMCRITYEHYRKTVYHNELMHIKIEKMLPVWLAPVYETPVYFANVDFEYDIKKAKKKERLRRRALGLSSEEEEAGDYDSESDEGEA
jgi:hypothetical protein